MSPRSHSVGALNPVLYPLFLLIVPHANASVVTNGKNLHTALIFGGRRQLLKKKKWISVFHSKVWSHGDWLLPF